MAKTFRSPGIAHRAHKHNSAVGMEGKTRQSLSYCEKIISRETLLAYPDFFGIFEIHMDASNYQLGCSEAKIASKGTITNASELNT